MSIYVGFWYIDPNFGPEWNTGGEAELGDDLEELYQSSTPTGPKVPEGTTFIGWYKMDTNTYEVTDELVTEVYAPAEYEDYIYVAAKYTTDTYTIIFEDEHGTQLGTQTGVYNDTIVPPSVVVPTGYDLAWVDEYDNPMPTKMQGDATYHTLLTPHTHTLTIYYQDTHGTQLANTFTQPLNYGTEYLVTSPSISGYALVDDDQAEISGTMLDENITVYVYYDVVSYTLTIYYVYQYGGEAATLVTQSLHAGDTYSVTSPTLEHYTTATTVVSGTMPAEDVEVWVQYVCADYDAAIVSRVRQEDIYGTLTFKDGTTIELTASNIQQGSLSITKQCVDGEEFMFGSAILTELNIAIWSERSRYDFYGAVIRPVYRILINTIDDEETWEDVPLGVFTVNDAERTQKYVSLTAYDNLQKLDSEIGTATIIGTPFYLLQQICGFCGLELGTTVQEIGIMPNAEETISITQDVGDTWRDGVKTICQMLGAFATTDANGKLIVRQFGSTATRTYTPSTRKSVTIADYWCGYYKLNINSVQGEFNSTRLGLENPLIMTMDAPAWDSGLPETLQTRADMLLSYLIDIQYTPCELSVWGDPKLQCGDMIVNVVGEDEIVSLVTEIQWKFRDMMEVSSVGKNAFFDDVTNSSKRSATTDTAKNKMVLYQLTNTRSVTAPEDTPTLVAETTFSALKNTYALFQGNLQLTLDNISGDYANVTVLYILNNQISVPVNLTVSKLPAGPNVIPLFYLLPNVEISTPQHFAIWVYSDDGTVSVNELDLKGALTGQGLVDSDEVFKGTINITEPVTGKKIGLNLGLIGDEATATLQNVVSNTASETLSVFKFSNTFGDIIENAIGTASSSVFTITPYLENTRVTTNCTRSEDLRSWIGAGTVGTNANTIITDAFWYITAVSVFYTGNPQIQFSNDDGVTWLGYDITSHDWEENHRMNISELPNITQAIWEDFRQVSTTEVSVKIKIYVPEQSYVHSINIEGGSIDA